MGANFSCTKEELRGPQQWVGGVHKTKDSSHTLPDLMSKKLFIVLTYNFFFMELTYNPSMSADIIYRTDVLPFVMIMF